MFSYNKLQCTVDDAAQRTTEDEVWLSHSEGYLLLHDLLAMDTPSGDEDVLSDWLFEWITAHISDGRMTQVGASLVAVRGEPKTAIFAHTDTTGYTLGYGNRLIPIGGPHPKSGDKFWMAGNRDIAGIADYDRKQDAWFLKGAEGRPGSRWIYASKPEIVGGEVHAPYLDNRGGVWAALVTLLRSENIAVAFTSGEEHNSVGATVCARYLFDKYGIEQALISDLTWDTDDVHIGQGVAVSRRDHNVPRQRFLNRVLDLAAQSGKPFQIEIETSGSSDAGGIQRSGCPMDWLFVGAPERNPHTSVESVAVADLRSMADMLTYLVERL